ncbi:hypothetical protein F4802DRAFT_573055 [Xylaria palmicola]|nr:hypothetical protein F4802DRAFT_573055 [Xylaria palmicola]
MLNCPPPSNHNRSDTTGSTPDRYTSSNATIEKLDNMATRSQSPIQAHTPTKPLDSKGVRKCEGGLESPKSVGTGGETTPKNASAGQASGKGKGKSKNAKGGRSNQKSGSQVLLSPKEEPGASKGSIGSHDTTPKVQAAVGHKPEVLGPNTSKATNVEQRPVAEDQSTVTPSRESPKNASIDQAEKETAREEAVVLEKRAVRDGAGPMTTTDVELKNGKNGDKDITFDLSRTDPGATKAIGTSTSTKPKHGKWKNRSALKKGVGAQPIAKASKANNPTPSSSPTAKAAGDEPHSPPPQTASGAQSTKTQARSPLRPKPNVDASLLGPPAARRGSNPKPKPKPAPALAPIPLRTLGPWRKVTGPGSATEPRGGVAKGAEKEPMDGERKGG